MRFPARNPLLKIASAFLFLYALVWISLEGRLWRATLLAVGVATISAAFAWQRFLGGREVSPRKWLAVAGITGLLCGLTVGLLTIIFMVIKTGLHGHGPEFTPAEISWVLDQIPLWSAVGLLTGLGVGVLISGVRKE
jgi:hypothetical protein